MLPLHISRKLSVFNYNEIPAGYYYNVMLEGAPIQKFWHRVKFEEVAKRIPPHARVLDMGCGPGSFLSILGHMYPKVTAVGVDIAGPQIDFAHSRVSSLFADERIKFDRIEENSGKISYPDASFDVITCIEVIEHIHPYFVSKLLSEARRLLKPDGKLIITTPNYRSFWPFIEMILERISKVKYHDQHINKFTPNSFIKTLESSGFEMNEVNSFFLSAPFLAPFGEGFARAVHSIENQLPVRMGSLLLGEAKILNL